MKTIADIKIAISCFMIALTSVVSAQSTDGFRRKYETETIYFSGNGYIKNETKYRLSHLKTEFDFSKEGMLMHNESRKDQRKFYGFYVLSLGALIAGGATYHQNRGLSAAFYAGSLASVSTSIYFAIRSQNRLQKAVWLRNRDVLVNTN